MWNHVSFPLWFDIIISSCGHIVTNDRVPFFLWLNKVLLCVYHTVFIPLSAKERLPGFRCLASLSWDRHYRWPLCISISSWLDKHLVVEWVNQMVDLFAMLEGPSMSLSIVAALIYATTVCSGVVPLLHECPALVTFSFFISHFPYEVISHCVGFGLYPLNNLSCWVFLIGKVGIFLCTCWL